MGQRRPSLFTNTSQTMQECFILFSFLSLCLAISLVLRKIFKVRNIIFIIYCVTCGTTLVTSNSNMITHTVEKYVSMEYFKLSFLFLTLCSIFSLVLRMPLKVRNMLFIFSCAICVSPLFASHNHMLTHTEEKITDFRLDFIIINLIIVFISLLKFKMNQLALIVFFLIIQVQPVSDLNIKTNTKEKATVISNYNFLKECSSEMPNTYSGTTFYINKGISLNYEL